MDPLGILAHSGQQIVDVDSRITQQFGYERSELLGHHILEFIHPDHYDLVKDRIQRGDEGPYETLVLRKDRRYVLVQVQALTLTSQSQPLRVVVLREVGSQLAQGCEQHNRFLHELRSPLTNLHLALRMSGLAPFRDKQMEYLNLAIQECEREIALVENCLTLRQLQARSYPLAYRPVKLPLWLPVEVESFALRAQHHQQQFFLDVPIDFSPISTDPAILSRVLQELLNNASKYTPPEGQIRLVVSQDPDGVRFAVANSAPTPPEALPRLFETFYRVPQGGRRGGNGLGLALVKEMLHQLQGSIRVESAAGWTIFTFWIPA